MRGQVFGGARRARGAPPQNALIAINGQSNVLGVAARSELASAPLNADAGLATFDAGVFSRVYIWSTGSNSFEQLDPGSNNVANATTQFGPEFGLAVRWMRETVAGNLYLIKVTENGSTIAAWRDGQALFEAAQARGAAAAAWLSSAGITIHTRGWLWGQGESDYLQSQAYYTAQLDGLHSERVSTGLWVSGERIVIAQMNASTPYYSANVAAAKTAFVASDSTNRAQVSFANYFNVDGVHLNARGQLQLGYDAFEQIFQTTHLDA